MTNNKEELINMKIHSFKEVSVGPTIYIVCRVPGGLIYSNYKIKTETFVPLEE